MASQIFIKTGIMVGLDETKDEIVELMQHAVEAAVELRDIGRNLGIRWVFSRPLVRSSYHAEDVFEQMMSQK